MASVPVAQAQFGSLPAGRSIRQPRSIQPAAFGSGVARWRRRGTLGITTVVQGPQRLPWRQFSRTRPGAKISCPLQTPDFTSTHAGARDEWRLIRSVALADRAPPCGAAAGGQRTSGCQVRQLTSSRVNVLIQGTATAVSTPIWHDVLGWHRAGGLVSFWHAGSVLES